MFTDSLCPQTVVENFRNRRKGRMGREILFGWLCNTEPRLPPFCGIRHGLWGVYGTVGDVFVQCGLLTNTMETVRTDECLISMFGSSGHEMGEVFNESIMLIVFIG